jgi:hypothetical protein
MAPAFTSSYTITITNCSVPVNGTARCPVILATSETLSEDGFQTEVDCSQRNSSQCALSVPSPLSESEHYVRLTLQDVFALENLTVSVSFDLEGRRKTKMFDSFVGYQFFVWFCVCAYIELVIFGQELVI